jgi:tetratricopeptide (TPR) repeat protein
MKKSILILLTLTLSTPLCFANAYPALLVADATATKEEEALYKKGSKAIDEERWDAAVAAFRQLKSGARGDAALYWIAYAQHKAGRGAEALTTLQEMKQKHPASRWNDDAKALEIEIRQSSGQRVAPESIGDDDLKLLAITSLLHSDSDRAIGMLEKMLKSNNSAETKEQALFVLSQSSAPRAQALIESVARGGSGRELQENALQLLGTSGNPRNRTLLNDVYQKATDRETKEAALQGLMLAGDRQAVFAAASGEKDPELRGDAAHLLGVMRATAELDRLYAAETSVEVKEEILQGMFVAGNVSRLAELSRSEKNPDLRVAAIHSLGASGGKGSGELLLELWRTESDPDVKEAIIEGLFIQGNASALVTLARKETNRELKRSIVEKLANMKSKEARDYMRELLDE